MSSLLSRRRLAGALTALLLALAATGCSSDEATGGGDGERREGPAVESEAAVEGCDGAWTDPADDDPERQPARCEAGAPAADPLPEMTSFTIASSTLSGEFISAVRYGIEHGEFEAENLDVDLQQLAPTDALPLLGRGEIDAMWSAPDAGFFNAISGGFDVRWVAGNYFAPPESKTGLWIRTEPDAPAPSIADLRGKSFATIVGKGSVSSYPIAEALAEEGLTIDDVDFQTLPAADLITAFENGAVDAEWLVDPLWVQFDGEPGYHFVAGQPPAEPLGGLLYGPSMLRDDTEAGTAFVRAYLRTINTYFAEDYKEDADFVAEVAEILEVPVEQLSSVPSLVMDWEIREGTVERLQQVYIDAEIQTSEEPLAEDDAVDRSFYEAAVGHTP